MSFTATVTQSVCVLVGLILFCNLLRRVGVVKEEHGALFSRLITQVTLPAVIFLAMSERRIQASKLLLPAVIIAAELACALLAWGAGRMLRLSRPRKGALILASTFGSSAFLGYAVVQQVYAGDPEAMYDAVVLSEIGVGILIFTVGVLIATHYGSTEASAKERRAAALSFLYSPILIALLLGIACSFVDLPRENVIVGGVLKALGVLAHANTAVVALTLGVMLKFTNLLRALPVVLLACLLKLAVQPALVYYQAQALGFDKLAHEVSVLEAAMPTAALCAVFAKRYGCDAELSSLLVFATFLSSIFSMVLAVFLLG